METLHYKSYTSDGPKSTTFAGFRTGPRLDTETKKPSLFSLFVAQRWVLHLYDPVEFQEFVDVGVVGFFQVGGGAEVDYVAFE